MGEENIKLYLFADDTKIYCHVKNLTEEDNLQRGIENLVDWTNRWQVSLNCRITEKLSVHHAISSLGLFYYSDCRVPKFTGSKILRIKSLKMLKI